MSAYLIVQLNVTDPETFAEYKKQVEPTIDAFGGEYVIRGGTQEVLEGDWPFARTVVIKFPSMEKVKAWHASDMYKGPMALRQSASVANALIVEGL
ncbi:MAG: DUF1330 domain-containing protein [Rhodospirillales bacterium]|nr:DUF1330 domain-containing protein [Rhodospirillales bacterium]